MWAGVRTATPTVSSIVVSIRPAGKDKTILTNNRRLAICSAITGARRMGGHLQRSALLSHSKDLRMADITPSLRRITDRLSEEHPLLGPQVELLRGVLLVAVVEPRRQSLGRTEQIDVLRDQAGRTVVV